MIPYVQVPDLHLGPLTFHPFGFLVAAGVFVGISLARWRGFKAGIPLHHLDSFVLWILAGGFLGAHVLDCVFYHPDVIARRPWSLLILWEGMSSFGGFVGGAVGALAWKAHRGRRQSLIPLVDVILSVFPIAWIFGRAGCAIVHDHPGVRVPAGTWLAVAYPGGARYDLGLLEMIFALVLSAVVALLWRRPRATGTYIAVVALAYAPIRFALDFLRITTGEDADPRYWDMTFAQWACIALFAFGLVVARKVLVRVERRRHEAVA